MLSITERVADMYKSVADKDGETREGRPFSRYKSWEYCHEAFKNARNRIDSLSDEEKSKDYDTLALHLAFYLASWGMYRGSSFLLQRDYKAHVEAVKRIMQSDSDIWDYDPYERSNEDNKNVAQKIMNLKKEIIASYGTIEERKILDEEEDATYEFKVYGYNRNGEPTTTRTATRGKITIRNGEAGENCKLTAARHVIWLEKELDLGFVYDNFPYNENEAEITWPDQENGIYKVESVEGKEFFSETLVTKILMGTIGSVPAYDRFFKDAIIKTAQKGIPDIDKRITSKLTAQFNESGLIALFAFARDSDVHSGLMKVNTNYTYPVMKKVDMYFWQYGYELSFLSCRESENGEKNKDSQMVKLLKKKEQEQDNEWRPQDVRSARKINAQLGAFIEGGSESEEDKKLKYYYDKLKERNA